MRLFRGLSSIAVLVTLGAPAVRAAEPEIIDLNRASLEELLGFDGIGRMYAAKLVAARPFHSRSELVSRNILPMPVYLAIKHRLFVTSAGTPSQDGEPSVRVPSGMVDLNSASVDALLAVPGIGRAHARRIVSGRPYRHELELVSRRIVPLSVFRSIEGRVAVER